MPTPRDHAPADLAPRLLPSLGMTPAPPAPETIQALSLELREVEWFGRSMIDRVPARILPIDLLLMVCGAIAGSLLYLSGLL